jgi:hypothetical protein
VATEEKIQFVSRALSILPEFDIDGAVAAVGGPFPGALLAGLRGKGKAKAWDSAVEDAMFVRYDSLHGHLSAVLSDQTIDHKTTGETPLSKAVLATIRPIPLSKCTIEIANAPKKLEGEVAFKRNRAAWAKPQPLTSRRLEVALEPDDYQVRLSLKNATAQPMAPVAVDLYEDRKVIFKMGAEVPAAGVEIVRGDVVGAAATVKVAMPERTTLQLRNINSGEETPFTAPGKISVPQGRYLATWRSADNYVLKRQAIDLVPGKTVDLGLTDWGLPHKAIADQLRHKRAVVFSKSLGGAIADPDLDLWLALMGGGRILGSMGDYSKLSQLPLHDFSGEIAGASPIYVLAGLEAPHSKLRVGLSKNAKPAWIGCRSAIGYARNSPGLF